MPDLLPHPHRDWAIFLDVDGTILDLAPRPDLIDVPRSLVSTLAALRQSLKGALALVSGRAIADLDRLFGPMTAAGLHGAELRMEPLGPLAQIARHPLLNAVAPALERFAAENPGILIEDKGATVAIHYRLAPSLEEKVHRTAAELLANAGNDLELLPARMAFEIKPAGIGKERAIAALMEAPAFEGRVPVFLGDDVTDEGGFTAAQRLGGEGICVGCDRVTQARYRIADPAAVRQWLRDVANELSEVR
jgi:trehalose 6-phosphate phosphatase